MYLCWVVMPVYWYKLERLLIKLFVDAFLKTLLRVHQGIFLRFPSSEIEFKRNRTVNNVASFNIIK